MSAEPATALPSSGFLRIFATFYRALLVARRHFVAPRKLYQEPRDDDDGSSRRVLSLHPNQVLRRDFCERDDDLATHGERDRSDARRRRTETGTHTRAIMSHGTKNRLHTHTRRRRSARASAARKGTLPAQLQSPFSLSITLSYGCLPCCRRLYFSQRTSPRSANGARPRVRGGGTRERFLLLRRPSARGSRHPEIWRVGKKIGQQRSSSATRAIFPVNCTS